MALVMADVAGAKSKAVTQRPHEDFENSPPNESRPQPAESPAKAARVTITPDPAAPVRERSRPRREKEYVALKIVDFETHEERNDFDGGYFGIWNKDPDDLSQGCTMHFDGPGAGGSDGCLRLDYDVDAFHEAYNGFWLLFVDIDLTSYSNVCFWVKGDSEAGFSKTFALEMKNEDETAQTIVDNITDKWQLKRIPFSEFNTIHNWYKMTEFVIVFKDRLVSKPTGTIYIDDIFFDAGTPEGTVEMADTRLSDEEADKSAPVAPESQRRPAGPTPTPLYEKTGASR